MSNKARDLTSLHKLILSELKSLTEIEQVQSKASATVTLDQACTGRLTRMDALQQQAMSKANQQRSQLRLTQLKHALKNIEQESYGYCAECDEEIAMKRLAANPVAKFCISCANAREKQE